MSGGIRISNMQKREPFEVARDPRDQRADQRRSVSILNLGEVNLVAAVVDPDGIERAVGGVIAASDDFQSRFPKVEGGRQAAVMNDIENTGLVHSGVGPARMHRLCRRRKIRGKAMM